jgi:type VI secretion system secreted protein Hcp
MSKVLLLSLLFGIIATMGIGSAYAASADYFLKIEGVDGESTDDKHKGEIQIESWSWGASNSGSMSMGGGGGAGKATFQDFHFSHKVDKSSPLLFQAMATGEHLKQVVLTVRKSGGEQTEYLTYTFTDALISSWSASGSSSVTLPIEEVSFNFSKIEMEYKPMAAAGTVEASVKASWDLKSNTK